jgi:hypothetical protein
VNPLRIVIGQRGWVWIGRLSYDPPAGYVLTEARCIRRWGTTRGLGQIALEGPTPDTILDDVGTVRIHPLAVVATYDVLEEKWA